MTALYAPEGEPASDIVAELSSRGIVVSGGLVAGIKDRYFRIGCAPYASRRLTHGIYKGTWA